MAKLNSGTILFSKGPGSFLGNRWLDSSICGNGKVGVAVTGAFANEAILVGHASLRAGGYTSVLQDVSDKFPQVRKLYSDGKIHEAERLLASEMAKRGNNPSPDRMMPLCVLGLDFYNVGQVTDYLRVTDMESAEVTVSFKSSGTDYERSLHVGHNTDVIAYKVEKTGPEKINVKLSINDPNAKPVEGGKAGAGSHGSAFKYEGGYLYFAARLAGGGDYGLVARLIIGSGSAEHKPDGIIIKDVDGLTIFAKTFVGGSREAEFKSLRTELSAIKNTYEKLRTQSEAAHRKVFNQTRLTLAGSADDRDVAAMIAGASDAKLPAAIIERLWNLGKYIAICSGGQIMTSDGLWCGMHGEGDGCFSFNNAAQLLYGGVMASVSPDVILDLFEYFQKHVDDLKKNAARVYGARGYFVPNIISPNSALFGNTEAKTLHFVASAALAANLFYNYFLVTGDTKILKSKIFPFMREVFNFYSDFLKLDNNGFYTTIPSYSPDSTPGNSVGGKALENFAFTTNSTIDFLAFDKLLENLIHAAGVLGDKGEVAVWQDVRGKVPPFSVDANGAIREYTNSAFIDGAVNCGCLHTYGLWPLKNFSFTDLEVQYKPAIATASNPLSSIISLKKASANAVLARLAKASHVQNVRTISMYAAQMAHTGDGASVRNLLIRLVVSCVTPSGLALTNDWRGSGWTRNSVPSLDICGNLGFATAVTECIVQSDARHLRILPAAFHEIREGEVTEVATDFGARVSVQWDMPRGQLYLKIVPKLSCIIDIEVNPMFKKPKAKDIKLDNGMIRGVNLVAGKAVSFEFQG